MSKSNPVLNDELIEDRELPTAMDDQLGHLLIAQQLAELVRSVPAPSNIALFGPWGSGKSSIANLLKEELAAVRGVKFARFDAFKYAENPLRRNFISAVAAALKIYKQKYHDELYLGHTRTDFEVPLLKIAKLAGVFAIILAGCAGIALLICAIISFFADQGFWRSFLSLARGAAITALVPASILTALVAFVGKTFVVEKKVEKAESDEQFEKIFRGLVDESQADPLVVFVDELDRCAPAEVVSALDAIRTFLGVRKCIFIVAADQQVLEQALSESVKQATPADTLNPYYSSGSAYLDKVFQYQLSIPPLLPQKVSQFAAGLVRRKSGIWTRIDVDLVVSILVPSHVRSPRRVKNLLNSFVLLYRHAERRVQAGQLDLAISERVDEIAKLACLRVEFPLFARDLVVDARLSEYILRLSEESSHHGLVWNEFGNVAPDVKEIARRYAQLEARVDYYFSGDEKSIDDAEVEDAPTEVQAVNVQQGKQLLDYLSRTSSVPGPKLDIIHLQSAGNLFGLAATDADQVERAAQDGALRQLNRLVGTMPLKDLPAVVSFLTQQARSAIGVEASNVTKSLLYVAGIEGIALGEYATSAIESISPVVGKIPSLVDATTIIGAWRLAAASDRPVAIRLRDVVVDSPEIVSNPTVCKVIFADTGALFSRNLQQVTALVLDKIVGTSPDDWYECVRAIDSEHVSRLVTGLDSMGLAKRVRAIIGEHENWTKAQKVSAQAAATGSASTAEAPEPSTGRDALDFLERWIRDLVDGNRAAAERLLRIVLDVRHARSRSAAGRSLDVVAPIESSACTAMILHEMTWQETGEWPRWMKSVSSDSVDGAEVVKSLEMAVGDLWGYARDADDDDYFREVEAAADALAVVLDKLSVDERASIAYSPSDYDRNLVSSQDVEKQQQMRRALALFSDRGIFSVDDVIGIEIDSLASTFNAAEAPESTLVQPLIDGVEVVLARFETLERTRESHEGLLSSLHSAIADCTWLSEPSKTLLLLHTWAISRDLDRDRDQFPTSRTLVEFLQSQGVVDSMPLVHWMRAVGRPSGEDLTRLVHAYRGSGNDLFSATVTASVLHLGSRDRDEFLEAVFADPTKDISSGLASAITSGPRSARLPGILVHRFEAATNNNQRRSTLAIWIASNTMSANARRTAIQGILIPLFDMNRQAFDIALDFLPRFAPVPADLKRDISSVVAAQVEGESRLERKALDVLKKLGFATRKSGVFGFRRESLDENR